MTAKLTMGAMTALLLSGSLALASAPAAAQAVKAQTVLKPATAVRAHRAPATNAAPDGAVASLVNVEGLRPGQLVLSGRILADIYSGKITMWDAPQIAHWNPGVALPHAAIVVIRPQDASPTTFVFANFLAAQGEIAHREAASGLSGSVAGQGDAAVASAVRGTRNSIGFVDYHFAVQNGLPLTKVITRQGVSPVLTAPNPAAMIAKSEVIAPMRAESPARAPTLGKLSFITNPPSVLGESGRDESSVGAAKADHPN